MAEAPLLENQGSLLKSAQAAQINNAPREAIEFLRDHLRAHRVSISDAHDVDLERFSLLRRLCGIKQKDLANKIGVSSSKLCQFENGNGRLEFAALLLAADVFGVEARQIVGGRPPFRSNGADARDSKASKLNA